MLKGNFKARPLDLILSTLQVCVCVCVCVCALCAVRCVGTQSLRCPRALHKKKIAHKSRTHNHTHTHTHNHTHTHTHTHTRTAPQAALLLLFNEVDELSYSEVQQRLNLPEEDISRLLHRCVRVCVCVCVCARVQPCVVSCVQP